MSALLLVATSFPAVVFTVLLGVVLAYWMLVFLGGLSVNLLGGGEGHDLGLDGGHDVGLDAGHDVGLDGHDVGGGEGHDLDADADVGDGTSILAALKLRSAPMTLVLSLVITFSWLFSVLLQQAVHGYAPQLDGLLIRLGILVLAPILSLLPTSITIRPLAPLFVVHQARGHQELVGHVVTIRSGSVTERFGEATFDDGAAGFIVQVRSDGDDVFTRGEQALLVGWDETRDTFTVAPMKDLLARRVAAEKPVNAAASEDVEDSADLASRRSRH